MRVLALFYCILRRGGLLVNFKNELMFKQPKTQRMHYQVRTTCCLVAVCACDGVLVDRCFAAGQRKGDSALHIACFCSDDRAVIVKSLLDVLPDTVAVNARSPLDGATPLMRCCEAGSVNCAKLVRCTWRIPLQLFQDLCRKPLCLLLFYFS